MLEEGNNLSIFIGAVVHLSLKQCNLQPEMGTRSSRKNGSENAKKNSQKITFVFTFLG